MAQQPHVDDRLHHILLLHKCSNFICQSCKTGQWALNGPHSIESSRFLHDWTIRSCAGHSSCRTGSCLCVNGSHLVTRKFNKAMVKQPRFLFNMLPVKQSCLLTTLLFFGGTSVLGTMKHLCSHHWANKPMLHPSLATQKNPMVRYPDYHGNGCAATLQFLPFQSEGGVQLTAEVLESQGSARSTAWQM